MITRRDFLKVTAAGGALASLGSVTEAKAAMKSAVPDEGFCHEGARKIPVIAEVDLVVAGGSSRAIAAAVAAAKTGSRVYLVGYMWLTSLRTKGRGKTADSTCTQALSGEKFPDSASYKENAGRRADRQQRTVPLQQLCNECADGPVR